MRMTLLALALILPGAAEAQLQSGPNAPSVGSQLPRTEMPRDPAGPTDSPGQRGPRTGDTARTAPPPGHQVLPAPELPGATPPRGGEGFGTTRNPIPDRPGARPDASTTGR